MHYAPPTNDPEPEGRDLCSCSESAWLRRQLSRLSDLLVVVHNATSTSPELRRQLKEALGLKVHRCCHPDCPGYPYRASEVAHPVETCGAKMEGNAPAHRVDLDDTDESALPLEEIVLPRVKGWLREAMPECEEGMGEVAILTLKLVFDGWEEDGSGPGKRGQPCFKCRFVETRELADAQGTG